MNLQTKIAAKRAQLEAERRADMLDQGVYFNESAQWWFEEAADATEKWPVACRQAAIAAATASHLAALTIITLENTP